MRIAVVGGIGCGKSQVCKVAKKLGYDVVSADQINKEMLQDQNYLMKVKEKFPEAFESGSFDKSKLSNIIFSNKERREELNKIAHPEILKRMFEKPSNYLVAELPLFIESGCDEQFDRILLVHTNLLVRLKRLKGRGVNPIKALKIINSQVKKKDLIDVATDILVNNGTMEELECEATKFFKSLKDNR